MDSNMIMAGGLDEAETVGVTFTVRNARRVAIKGIFALVDVQVTVAEITFDIFGVQARREHDGRTSVRLPTYKDENGYWQQVIRLPEETRTPLADAILAFLIDEGIAERRFAPLQSAT